jgi:hypothetical protein
MFRNLKRHFLAPGRNQTVLEVGSMDVNGCTRQWFTQAGYDYKGADVEPGPNVDIVIDKSCSSSLRRKFDLIVSLNTFEHMDKPWVLLPTIAGHLRKGGKLLVVAPFSFPYHRHPVNCYRYSPDGMRVLADVAGLRVRDAYLDYEASATLATLYDIGWRIRRRRFTEAISKLWQWRTRMPVWNCIAEMSW